MGNTDEGCGQAAQTGVVGVVDSTDRGCGQATQVRGCGLRRQGLWAGIIDRGCGQAS